MKLPHGVWQLPEHGRRVLGGPSVLDVPLLSWHLHRVHQTMQIVHWLCFYAYLKLYIVWSSLKKWTCFSSAAPPNNTQLSCTSYTQWCVLSVQKKKKEGQETRSGSICWCGHFKNPHFVKWRLIIVMYHRKSMGAWTRVTGSVLQAPDGHRMIWCMLGGKKEWDEEGELAAFRSYIVGCRYFSVIKDYSQG